MLRIALPSYPTELAAHVSLNLEHLAPKDTLVAVVKSSDGSHGLFERSEGGPSDSRKTSSFTITGTQGWIDRRPGNNLSKVTVHKVKKDGKGEEDIQVFEFKNDDVKNEIEYWALAVLGKPTLDVGDPRETLRDVAFIEASLKSNGEKVDLVKLLEEGK